MSALPLSPIVPAPIVPDLFNLIWLLVGLFLAGILEAILWQTPLFNWANYPIQATWFGANKRWRGLISLPLTHACVVALLQGIEHHVDGLPADWITFTDVNVLTYGLGVGLCCNLAELPNSFMKRRLGIPPGDQSHPIFFVIDHCDSAIGILLAWGLCFQFPLHLLLTGAIASPFLFMLATIIRVQLKLK